MKYFDFALAFILFILAFIIPLLFVDIMNENNFFLFLLASISLVCGGGFVMKHGFERE